MALEAGEWRERRVWLLMFRTKGDRERLVWGSWMLASGFSEGMVFGRIGMLGGRWVARFGGRFAIMR